MPLLSFRMHTYCKLAFDYYKLKNAGCCVACLSQYPTEKLENKWMY